MLHRAFILRQLYSTRKQGLLFVLCSMLSITTLVALGNFSDNIQHALLQDARRLHTADIIVQSRYPFASKTLNTIIALQQQGQIKSARSHEFYSVVRTLNQAHSLLVHLKVVDHHYPLYGQVKLGSARPFHDVLTPGNVIVEPSLLDRLHVAIGDQLHVGKITLTIRDTVRHEPDRPTQFFSLGPRLFAHQSDLEAMDLVKHGSRINHILRLKVQDESQESAILSALQAIISEAERVDTFRTASSGIKEFFDNFIFFLKLVGILTMVLAGIGMRSTVVALSREQSYTIAILKSVGATNRFILIHYLLIVTILGIMGTFLGLVVSALSQPLFGLVFAELLPRHLSLTLSARSISEGLVLGLIVMVLFAFSPLYRLQELKPNLIFHHNISPPSQPLMYLLIHIIPLTASVVGLVLWQVRDVVISTWFIGCTIALMGIIAFLAAGILWGSRRFSPRSLTLKLAFRGLLRPGNATRTSIVTLTTAMTVLFSIYLLEYNLDATFVHTFPENTPNLFFLDIQPAQREDFAHHLSTPSIYYPIITARILSVNGQAINRQKERQRRGDNLAREFRLTYRHQLLPDEALRTGNSLFQPDWGELQVSVLDIVTEMQPIAIGDSITFRIQGVPLTARVSSIRTRTRKGIRPFFYFVFPESVLRQAPQTIFTAVHVDRPHLIQLQNKMVTAFPNVSVIDITQAISDFALALGKLSTVVRLITLSSLVAGLLIVISAIFATQLPRIQEAVYFKILGATSQFIISILTFEHLLLSGISALLAVVLSHVISWVVTTCVLAIPYQAAVESSMIMLLGATLIITAIGLLASRSIAHHKPASFLHKNEEI